MTRWYTHLKQKLKGSVAVEFAIITPVFLWLVAAGLEIGLYFYAQFSFENMVQEIVRESYNTNAFARDDIKTYLTKITSSRHIPGYSSGSVSLNCRTTNNVALAAADVHKGVNDCTLSYPYTFNTPMVSDILGDQTVKAIGRFKFAS